MRFLLLENMPSAEMAMFSLSTVLDDGKWVGRRAIEGSQRAPTVQELGRVPKSLVKKNSLQMRKILRNFLFDPFFN